MATRIRKIIYTPMKKPTVDIVTFAEQIMGVELLEAQKSILRTVQNDKEHKQFIVYNNRAGKITLSRIIGEYLEYLEGRKEDEDSEMWRLHRLQSKYKKQTNEEKSLQILLDKGICYKILNTSVSHYRVGDYDFWPTTGKFYNQKTGERGRGVYNLIRKIQV